MRSSSGELTPTSPGSARQATTRSEITETLDCAGKLDHQSRLLIALKTNLEQVLAQQSQQYERLQQLGTRQEQILGNLLGQQLEARTPPPSAEPRFPHDHFSAEPQVPGKDPSSERWLAVLATLQSVEARLHQMQQVVEKTSTPASDEFATEFAGTWYEGEARHIITGRFLRTNSNGAGFSKLALEVHGPRDFSVSRAGEIVEHGELSEDRRQLLWRDGRVWSREPDTEPDTEGPYPPTPETPWKEVSKGTKGSGVGQMARPLTARRLDENSSEHGGSIRNVLSKSATFTDWLEDRKVKGPAHSRWIDRIVQSFAFEAVAAVVILINAVYIGYTADWFMEHPLEDVNRAFTVVDTLFCVFFTAELSLRAVSLGKLLLRGPDALWYLFDMFLIIMSVVELSIENSGGYTWLRSLRVFKLARVIRMVRTTAFLKELRLMMDCMIGSIVSLFWCLVMISFLIYLFALIFVQGLASVVEDLEQERVDSEASAADRVLGAVPMMVVGRQLSSSVDGLEGEERRHIIMKHYGSVGKAMLRLWTASTGGVDWQDEYEVIKLSGTMHAGVFIGCIAFMIVVVWNIVTSTILEKALRFAQPDIDQILIDKRRQDEEDMYLLESMFDKAGIDVTQTLHKEQLMELLEQRHLSDLLLARGIDIKEAFALLTEDSDGNEGIDAMTLLVSCLQIKGFATSIDLHTTHNQIMRVLRKQGRLLHANHRGIVQVEQQLLDLLMQVERHLLDVSAAQSQAAPSFPSRNVFG